MRRVALAGLVLTVLLVLVLIGSLVGGLRGVGSPESGPAAEGGAGEGEEARVRVEVLNAAGIPGLARSATERLRARGYDVVYYGNASGYSGDSSLVLDRVGRAGPAGEVAEAAEIGRVRTEVDTALYVDVTVIVGRDWAGIPTDSAAAGS